MNQISEPLSISFSCIQTIQDLRRNAMIFGSGPPDIQRAITITISTQEATLWTSHLQIPLKLFRLVYVHF